jgi:hypothetical protein
VGCTASPSPSPNYSFYALSVSILVFGFYLVIVFTFLHSFPQLFLLAFHGILLTLEFISATPSTLLSLDVRFPSNEADANHGVEDCSVRNAITDEEDLAVETRLQTINVQPPP